MTLWTHRSSRRSKVNRQHLHASDDGQSRLQDIAKDDPPELQLFFFGITSLMENPARYRGER